MDLVAYTNTKISVESFGSSLVSFRASFEASIVTPTVQLHGRRDKEKSRPEAAGNYETVGANRRLTLNFADVVVEN